MPIEPVLVILHEGLSGHEALGAIAALRAAGRPAEIVASDALVHTQEGARIVPHRLGYATVAVAPAIILPGGDIRKAMLDADLARALRARRGQFVLASGESIRLLAAAGLTEGRRVSRLPGDAPIVDATSVHARLVADGRLLTSFAGDALIDLVLHWIGHEDGDKVGERAAQTMGREWAPFAFGQSE